MHAHLILLPLLPLLASAAAPPALHPIQPYQNTALTSLNSRALGLRQLSDCPIGTSTCDTNWCGAVCCNLGNGNACPLGSRCVPGGCCPIGETCTRPATCTSRSDSRCSSRDDCCPRNTPYCIKDDLGSNICSSKPGLSGGSSGGDEEPEVETTTRLSTTRTSSSTSAPILIPDESTSTRATTTRPTTTSTDDDLFGSFTSKIGDVADAIATAKTSDDIKDILNSSVPTGLRSGGDESSPSAGLKNVVCMSLVAVLGMAAGAVVMV